MSVPSAVSLAHVRAELIEAQSFIEALGLTLDTSNLCAEDLRFRLSGASWVDNEVYIAEFLCDDYREKPPLVEFVDPDSGQLGTKRAYPNCFHKKPCICARYNRKTYSGHTGLHGNWEYGDWTEDSTTDRLGGMISHMWSHIHGQQGSYSGRQA